MSSVNLGYVLSIPPKMATCSKILLEAMHCGMDMTSSLNRYSSSNGLKAISMQDAGFLFLITKKFRAPYLRVPIHVDKNWKAALNNSVCNSLDSMQTSLLRNAPATLDIVK